MQTTQTNLVCNSHTRAFVIPTNKIVPIPVVPNINQHECDHKLNHKFEQFGWFSLHRKYVSDKFLFQFGSSVAVVLILIGVILVFTHPISTPCLSTIARCYFLLYFTVLVFSGVYIPIGN